MKFVVFLTFSFFFTTGALAQGTCEPLFGDNTTEASMSQSIGALAAKTALTKDNSAQFQKNIEELSMKIFKLNRKTLLEEARNTLLYSSRGDHRFLDPAFSYTVLMKELREGSIRFTVKPEKFFNKSHLHAFNVSFNRGREEVLSFSIRTNGIVAFIDCSYRYRAEDMMDYQAVAFSGDQIVNTSMGRIILDSLGDSVTLSRAMEAMERNTWIAGESEHLGSRRYYQRIHFALNYYYFNKFSPYMVKVPKQLLEKLFTEKKMEVNSYDTLEARGNGMPDVARTPFGLEVEFVISREAAAELMPYFSPAVRQGVLDFQDYLSAP